MGCFRHIIDILSMQQASLKISAKPSESQLHFLTLMSSTGCNNPSTETRRGPSQAR